MTTVGHSLRQYTQLTHSGNVQSIPRRDTAGAGAWSASSKIECAVVSPARSQHDHSSGARQDTIHGQQIDGTEKTRTSPFGDPRLVPRDHTEALGQREDVLLLGTDGNGHATMPESWRWRPREKTEGHNISAASKEYTAALEQRQKNVIKPVPNAAEKSNSTLVERHGHPAKQREEVTRSTDIRVTDIAVSGKVYTWLPDIRGGRAPTSALDKRSSRIHDHQSSRCALCRIRLRSTARVHPGHGRRRTLFEAASQEVKPRRQSHRSPTQVNTYTSKKDLVGSWSALRPEALRLVWFNPHRTKERRK